MGGRYDLSARFRYYPISISLAGCRCLVVGGGAVAARKVRALLRYGARVVVVSPRRSAAIEQAARAGQVTLHRRPFRSGDLAGAALAIAATDDPVVNAAVSRQAHRLGIWVNVVDAPELCTAIAPAVVQRGSLTIAISTGGASPALASSIRRQLERRYGTAYAPYLELLRAARGRVQARVPDPKRRAVIMHRLQRLDLLRWLRRGQIHRARRLLDDAVERAIRTAPRKRSGRHDVL